MKFIINKKEKSKIPSTKLYDLGSVTTDINDLLNTSIINIDQNTIPVLIIDGLNYLINNFNPNDYKEDFEILLAESDLISFSSGESGDFIPLTGTIEGNPVTGNIEFEADNGFGLFSLFEGTRKNRVSFDDMVSLSSVNEVNGDIYEIRLSPTEFLINANNGNGKGITGVYDYSANITDLDYTQKKYVDERGSIVNTTTATLSASDLNTAYPNAKDGFSVIAPNVIGGGKYYIKAGAGWVYQQILAVV